MGSLQQWLGPGLFQMLGTYLEGELGKKTPEDLRMLEPDQLIRIHEMLKPLPLKLFNTKFAELTGAEPRASLQEGVAEKPTASLQPKRLSYPTGLHSRGDDGACAEPEPEQEQEQEPQPQPEPEPEQLVERSASASPLPRVQRAASPLTEREISASW
eukprot:COSAG02_NODE_11589_length_1686_cov_1.477415_1_plen_156_part_01